MSKCKIEWCKNESYDGLYCLKCENLMDDARDIKDEMEKENDEYD